MEEQVAGVPALRGEIGGSFPFRAAAEPEEAAPPRRVPTALTRKQKAAVIVKILLDEGQDVSFRSLPEELQADLTLQMGAMGLVDHTTLNAVVSEFADELESVGLSFLNGMAGALSALDGRISPHTAARLRKEAGVRQLGDPWQRLRALSPAELKAMAESESVEVAAVLLSKLEVSKAAELLTSLPGERARAITYAITQTSAITPEAVDRIGISLAAQLDQQPERAFDKAPETRLGEILNYSASQTRDDVLAGIEEADADFAERLRAAIFTFENIPERIRPIDVPAILRTVDQDALARALSAAEKLGLDLACEFLLSNTTQRMATTLREAAAEIGALKQKDAEEAMNAVVRAIRSLLDSGEIELVEPEEDAP